MTDTNSNASVPPQPKAQLLRRRGVIVGISLLTAAGWLVYAIDHPVQRAQCLAAIAQHFPAQVPADCLAPSGRVEPVRPESVLREKEARAGWARLQQATDGKVAPRAGFEPATNRLTAGCSTTELPRNTAPL